MYTATGAHQGSCWVRTGGPPRAGRAGNEVGADMADGAVARGSRSYIRRAVEVGLRRLQTDYIDLYQYHEPDGITPMDEILAILDDFVTLVSAQSRYNCAR